MRGPAGHRCSERGLRLRVCAIEGDVENARVHGVRRFLCGRLPPGTQDLAGGAEGVPDIDRTSLLELSERDFRSDYLVTGLPSARRITVRRCAKPALRGTGSWP